MAHLVEPPEDAEGSQPSALDDEAFGKLAESELDDARKSAEGWRNGLAALIGLTAIASVLNGGASLSNLGTPYAITAGACLLAGITAAACGIVWSMRAAYGNPQVIERSSFARAGGIDGFRHLRALEVARDLKRSRWATLAALVFVVAAIGVVWYGPRAQETFVQIETTGLTHLCGRIVTSADGHIELKDPGGGTITVETKAIQSIRTVKRC
jgi:hypothetical protein